MKINESPESGFILSPIALDWNTDYMSIHVSPERGVRLSPIALD